MIYFAGNPYTHKVRAYNNLRALCYIYQGDTILNLKNPLLAYPQDGFYQFDLASFFRYYTPIRLPKPLTSNQINYLGEAQSFTIKTIVNQNEIHNQDLQFFPGMGVVGSLDRWFNQYLTFQPNSYEVWSNEPLFRYTYLNTEYVDTFVAGGTFYYSDGTSSSFVSNQMPYKHGLYLFDCSLYRYKRLATSGKEIIKYTICLCDLSNKPITPQLTFTIKLRPNYYPAIITYRNKLGTWDMFSFTQIKTWLDIAQVKGILEGNNEIPTQIENRDKIAVSSGAIKQSMIEALSQIAASSEIYLHTERVFLTNQNLAVFTQSDPIMAMQLEFQKSQVIEVHV